MVYNPIFEEEKERKTEFKELKKEIQKRARQEEISKMMTRVFHLLQKKPILTLSAIFHPIAEMVKIGKAKQV